MKKKDVIVLILGLFSFIVVAMWAKSGASITFDTWIYTSLHTLPETIAFPFFKWITTFGNTNFVLVLILILTILLWKYKGIHILGICIVDICLNQSLKYMIARPRPSFEHLVHASGYSFPSGHTMIALTLYGFLFYVTNGILQKWMKIGIRFICVFLMLFIPMSRIYLGVHYATDIIGGLLMGGCILYLYIKYLGNNK